MRCALGDVPLALLVGFDVVGFIVGCRVGWVVGDAVGKVSEFLSAPFVGSLFGGISFVLLLDFDDLDDLDVCMRKGIEGKIQCFVSCKGSI